MSGWRDDAKCAEADPELFFPSREDLWKIALAKQICAGCPVAAECIADGVDDEWSIRGGLVASQRKPMRAARLRAEGVA